MVQVGSFANFVGSQFWNLQNELYSSSETSDALLPSVLYFETASGRVLPRTMVVDTSGSLGSRQRWSTEGGQRQTVNAEWAGSSSTYVQDPLEENKFIQSLHEQDLASRRGETVPVVPPDDGSITYWTDFCKEEFHDRSLYQIPGVHFCGQPVENFIDGDSLLDKRVLEDLVDTFRWMAEQSDHLTGILSVCESDSGFTGVAARYLRQLRDDYPSLSNMVYGCAPQRQNRSYKFQMANEAWLAALASQINAQFVPLSTSSLSTNSFPFYQIPDLSNTYYTSSICAVGLEVTTLPLRMRAGTPIGGLFSALRPQPSWCMSSCELQFPAKTTGVNIPAIFDRKFQSLTPSVVRIAPHRERSCIAHDGRVVGYHTIKNVLHSPC